MPKSAGQFTRPCAAWLTALQNWPNSARTRVGLVWVMVRTPIRVGSTRCMVRCTVTDVAWFTPAQPVAAAPAAPPVADAVAAGVTDDVVAPPDEAGAAAGEEAVAEPHPATAEHSSTASTVPRTWRDDFMPLGRTPRAIRSMTPFYRIRGTPRAHLARTPEPA